MTNQARRSRRTPGHGDESEDGKLREADRNRIAGRFQQEPYPDTARALSGARSPNSLTLDGDWKFCWAPNPQSLPENAFDADADDASWQDIPVPSNWEQYRFGPQTDAAASPPGDRSTEDLRGTVPQTDADAPAGEYPVGMYRRTFDVPGQWLKNGGSIILRFSGIDYAARIWVNGGEIGCVDDNGSPAEFEISSSLKKGGNRLAVQVAGEGGNRRSRRGRRVGGYSGITGPVELLCVPDGGIFDIAVRSRFEDRFRHARLEVNCTLDCPSSAAPARTLRWYLHEPGTSDIFASGESAAPSASGEPTIVKSEVLVSHPQLWSAEKPFLYNLVVEVIDEAGRCIDVRSVSWGFRQVEIQPGPTGPGFRVNGQPVKLLGIKFENHHPRWGTALPREVIESDLRLLKKFNINAVLCSGSANAEALYEAADRLGLYVVDEATEDCARHVRRRILSRRNHPSIIIWSALQGGEAAADQLKTTAAELDGTRPVLRADDFRLDESDVLCLTRLPGKTEAGSGKLPRPKIRRGVPGRVRLLYLTPGSISGDFAGCIETIREAPNAAGCFLCHFTDAISYPSADRETSARNGAVPAPGGNELAGLFGPDRTPRAEAFDLKALYSPVGLRPADIETGRVVLVNRHSFTNLEDFEIEWILERDGVLAAEGIVRGPDIPPLSERQVLLFRDLAAFPSEGEGFVTVSVKLVGDCSWAAAGHEVARLQVPVPELAAGAAAAGPGLRLVSEAPETADEYGDVPWQWKRFEAHLGVAGPKVGGGLNLVTGALEALDFGRGNVLVQGLVPALLQGPREAFPGSPPRRGASVGPYGRMLRFLGRLKSAVAGIFWESISEERRLFQCRTAEVDGNFEVRCVLRCRGFIGPVMQKIVFHPEGRVDVRIAGRPGSPALGFGMRFALPSSFRFLRWYGLGPRENYAHRSSGAAVRLHEMDAAEFGRGCTDPVAGGNRSGVRWASVSDGRAFLTAEAAPGALIDFAARRGRTDETAVPGTGKGVEVLEIEIAAGESYRGEERTGWLGLVRRWSGAGFRRRVLEYTISPSEDPVLHQR